MLKDVDEPDKQLVEFQSAKLMDHKLKPLWKPFMKDFCKNAQILCEYKVYFRVLATSLE